MRVLFSGGGTGGHINPALAMADIIKNNIPDVEIAFVGTPKGMENSLIPQAGYKLYHVEIEGIRRSLSPANIKSAYLALTSPSKAKKIVREFAPDIVIGTGGYVCWPALKAAASLKIPTLLHESNALPGMAVRRLQTDVDVIMTNFESTRELLSPKANVINVGNPLRSACSTVSKQEARRRLNIPDEVEFVTLSFGGSLGAQAINKAAAEMMAHFANEGIKNVRCYHVGGKRHYASAKNFFSAYDLERDERFSLMEYTNDLPVYMAAADLVICRAGAMTITEISKMGKAAIIIPSPNVTDNHQYKNAKALADENAAVLICEDEMDGSGKKVCDAAEKILKDTQYRRMLEENIVKFAKNDVEKKIFETIMELLEKKKK